jgi:multicomponent Na+:H+ antiporter subunit B
VSLLRRRLVVFLPACVVLAAVLGWGLVQLPGFGLPHSDYARYLAEHAPAQRHASNVVATVVFDYRGWDTAGEELIMFAAVTGTALLLRAHREEGGKPKVDEVTSETLRSVAPLAVALALVVGLWTIAFGYITPGGGFQGGVVAASAALLAWLAGSYRRYRRVTPVPLVDSAEGAGAAGYLAVGLLGLAAGTGYLDNVLPLGSRGELASTGTIAVLNAATGLEIAAACVLIFHEFLEEYIRTLPADDQDDG